MDQVKFRGGPAFKKLFEKFPHEMQLLLPSSPMLNPTESAFSELKNYVRKNPKGDGKTVLKQVKEAETKITQRSDPEGWNRHCTKRSEQSHSQLQCLLEKFNKFV